MNSNFTIRVEEPRDFRTVENLTRESFWNVYHPGCTEHYILRCFRNNPEDFAKYEAEFPYKEKLVLPGQLG